MKHTAVPFLAILLCLLLLGPAACAEDQLNVFMGSGPFSEEPEAYQPGGNTRPDERVGSGDTLIYYFYRPACKYCSLYADMLLAGLPEEITLPDGRKSTVRMAALNKSDEAEGAVIQSYYERNQIAQDRQLVPSILIGDAYLCGSNEIKRAFLRLLLDGQGLLTPYVDGTERDLP